MEDDIESDDESYAESFMDIQRKVDTLERSKLWQYRIFICSLTFLAMYGIAISNIWKCQLELNADINHFQIFAFDHDVLAESSKAREQAKLEKLRSLSPLQVIYWGAASAVDTLQGIWDSILEFGLGSVFSIGLIIYLLLPDSKVRKLNLSD